MTEPDEYELALDVYALLSAAVRVDEDDLAAIAARWD